MYQDLSDMIYIKFNMLKNAQGNVRMKKSKLCLIVTGSLSIGLLSGCETMLPHYRLSDSYTRALGFQVAITESCVERSDWNPSLSYQLGYGAKELLDVAVADERLYEDGYNSGVSQARNMSSSQIIAECEKVEPVMPSLISRLNSAYASAVDARSMGMSSLNSSIADFNDSMRSFNESMIEQNKNTFIPYSQKSLNNNLQQSEPKHYLINTKNGTKQCAKMNSGYVYCY